MTNTGIAKLILGVLTVGSVGGATAFGIYELNKATIESKLKNTLLTEKEEDKEKWKNRATALNSDSLVLTISLKEIKNGKSDGSDIQNWCHQNLKYKFVSEEDQLFKEIQKYCVYSIDEKITGLAEISKWDNSTHNKKLKDNTNNLTLSKTMTEIKEKLTIETGRDENALKNWCQENYKKPFKGLQDQDYLDTKEFCISTQ